MNPCAICVHLWLEPGRTETFAFLFDMNQLFEEFIAEFIRRELRDVWQSRGWTLHAQSGTRHLLRDESFPAALPGRLSKGD